MIRYSARPSSRRSLSIGLALAVLLSALVPVGEAIDEEAPREVWRAIAEWNREFETALAQRDLAAVGGLFTKDAVLHEMLRPPVRGRQAIVDHLAYYLDMGNLRIESRTEEVYGNGDSAVEIGRSTAFLNGARVGGDRYMSLFRKVDGRWLLHRHIQTPG